jgi:ABC-type Fe3+ transport system substrate-binding protein
MIDQPNAYGEALAELRGRFMGNEKRVDALENAVKDIYAIMRDGFAQGQRDREAGNKAIGELIAGLGKEFSDMKDDVSQGKGALGMGNWIITGCLLLGSGLISALVGHVFK